jgi:hypothetical protein
MSEVKTGSVKESIDKMSNEEMCELADIVAAEQEISFDFFEALELNFLVEMKYIKGRMLTIIDAISDDDKQAKARKDLVHDALNECQKHYSELAVMLFNRVAECLYGDDAMKFADPMKQIQGDVNYFPLLKKGLKRADVYLPRDGSGRVSGDHLKELEKK